MKRRKFFSFSPIARRISIGVVIISVITVLGYLAASNYFAPEKMAHRELEKIAQDYYENFFYDNVSASVPTDQKTEKFNRPLSDASAFHRHHGGGHADAQRIFHCQVFPDPAVF